MYIFVIIVLVILLLAHFFVYFSLLTIFWLYKYKTLMKIIFILLSFSFILASNYVHVYNNSFVKWFYYITSVWHWLLSFLIIVFLMYFVTMWILKIFHITIHIKYIWLILVLIAVFLTWYWLINAKNIQVKNVDISIKNIPESWKTKKVLMISDAHIWAINWEKFLNNIVTRINELKPDILFICWDLFDGTDWDLENIDKYLNNINAKIYYVNWNHETYLWNEIVKKILNKTKIIDLDNQMIEVDWVQIVWLSYIDNRYNSWTWALNEEFRKINWFDKNKTSILLYHSPVYIEDFKKLWISLQLSWHTHRWQMWPYNYITKLIYKWKDYWLYTSWDYNLYTSNWIWTWWPPLRVWNTPEIVNFKFK